jgi:hypothetical protein
VCHLADSRVATRQMRRPRGPPCTGVEAGATLFLLPPVPARFLSLAAPTHHIRRRGFRPTRRVYEIFAWGYEGDPTPGRILGNKCTAKVYRMVLRSELGDSYAAAFEGMRMETSDGRTILTG